MASSAPVAATSAVAALGSSQRDGQEPPSSSLHQHDTAQANGNRSTGTTVKAHSSDLICVGMWTNREEQQDTNTVTNGVQLHVSQTACTRHRNLSRACSPSAGHPQIVTLLADPYAAESADNIRGGGASELSTALCTCVVAIEVYEDEAEPRKARTNGVSASERRLNGMR